MGQESINTEAISEKLEISAKECRDLCEKLTALDLLENDGVDYFKFSDPLFGIYLKIIKVENEIRIKRNLIYYEIQAVTKKHQISKAPTDEELRIREEAMTKFIISNYEKTGRSGLWG